jgi:formimidoylglutamate deiminase
MRQALLFDHALMPDGWAPNVCVTIVDGTIRAIEREAVRHAGEHVPGIALPGLPNVHCHAFQRGMAGLAERRGPSDDSFWTWREVMYRFLDRLTPEDVEAIAAFAYMEMLERGFTSVGEFHYLHHDRDGTPYVDIGELAGRIAAAATQTGIGLTLLPSFYAYGGFGGAAPAPGQRRFLNTPDQFLALVARTREIAAAGRGMRVGVAPHSLRAVTPETLRAVVAAMPEGPIHIHAAEQQKEVADCLAWSGRRPVAWLLDEMPVDARWCLIHATHMEPQEVQRLAASGAIAGLCPITEASLGDGVFEGAALLAAGGRFGIGTDSNIDIDAAGELRQLEYSQRLVRRARNVMATREGESTGRRLLAGALAGGAQALGRSVGTLAVGQDADIVVLDAEHADLAAVQADGWLDAWIFVAGPTVVRDVFAAGERVVSHGRHHRRDDITGRYRSTMMRLAGVT